MKFAAFALLLAASPGLHSEPVPEFLFHWTDSQGLEKMAVRARNSGRLPLKQILGDQWIAKHWPVFTDRAGLFAWPSPLTAVQTSGKEFYARVGPGGEAPRLIAIRIAPTARVLVLDTVLGSEAQKLSVSLDDYDLLFHRSRTSGGSKRYSEWIILHPRAVAGFSANPDKLPKKYKEQLKDWLKTLRRHPERTGLPAHNIEMHTHSLKTFFERGSRGIPPYFLRDL